MVESANASHSHVRKRAFSWHTKSRLQDWVRKKNVDNGLSVPSRLVTKRYNEFLRDVPFNIRLQDLRDPSGDNYAKVFLHRWRRAVHSKWGRIRVEVFVPLEEKRSKARFFPR